MIELAKLYKPWTLCIVNGLLSYRMNEPLAAVLIWSDPVKLSRVWQFSFHGPLLGLTSDGPVFFWQAGLMTAVELSRRLINLIYAGRNRKVMIRRELSRTKGAD